MAIQLPNNKISRTLPEQVGFNSQKIYEIIKFLNESGLKDQVINLTSLSGTLTPEQYAIAELSPSYIVYEGTIFFKGVEDLTYIDYFELTPQIETDSSMLLNMSRIRVVRDTRAYSQSYVNLFETYNKSQIDSLLSAELALKADLSGANFTGPITAPSIIENMSGYSFVLGSNTNYLAEGVYASVVKNGNKLTFVVALDLTKQSGAATNPILGTFTIPTDLMNKLFTTLIGSYNLLGAVAANIFSTHKVYVSVPVYISKQSTNKVVFVMSDSTNMVVDTKYYVRIEATFLLSDNLIP